MVEEGTALPRRCVLQCDGGDDVLVLAVINILILMISVLTDGKDRNQ